MQADFTMKVDNPLLRTSTTSRGTLYQRRPDRILLKFSEPEGDVIVGDGTYFWVYYPSVDAQQVMRAPAEQAGTGGVDLQAQFVGDPVQRFTYTLHGQETVDGRMAHVLTMVPKGDAGYDKLKVWVDTTDSLVRRFELTEENGAVRRFDLRNLRLNPNLSDALFQFTPPAGARVVQRN
jgi:outer membrane lipoprotein carrier protein